MITDGLNPLAVLLFVGAVLTAFALAATYAVRTNHQTRAARAHLVPGLRRRRSDLPGVDPLRLADE